MSALLLQDLRKVYANGFEALKGIDLEVAPGDFFALLGPNGAGKSTAIGIVSSLINKSSGRVEVFGHDLDRDPEGVKSCIGLVPQEFNFNQWEPVAEIVVNQAGFYGIPRSLAWQRAEESLRRLDLWDKRKEQAMSLSGGMKRRLMIARALVHRPQLLILDEPTAALDARAEHEVFLRFSDLIQGKTAVLISHRFSTVRMADRILFLENGQLLELGSHEELLAMGGKYAELFHLQAKGYVD